MHPLKLAALGAVAMTLPLVARPALAAPADADNNVVVTGVRLKDSERALKECIARKCPVEEDIAATLRHAENQFVQGQYREARGTLYKGRDRTRRFAKTYPVPVSTVTRAIATVSAHLGEPEAFQLASIDTLDALKAGLPRDDSRVLSARIEVANMFARLGRETAAEEVYQSVAKRARALDLVGVWGLAELRLAMLYGALADGNPGIYAQVERDWIARVRDNRDPRYAVFAKAARVLEARKLARSGDAKAFEAILQDLRSLGETDRPVLVYAPPIPELRTSPRGAYRQVNNSGPGGGVLSALDRMPMWLFDDQWVDLSFYVTPDGRVADVGILRTSPKLQFDLWVKPILGSIAQRRYLPMKRDPNDPGVLRVERYTLTSLMEQRTGSRISQRGPEPRIESLDLSIDPVPPAPASSPPKGSI